MPRKGKGSKTQPIQTASGQQYGEVAAQEQAQQAHTQKYLRVGGGKPGRRCRC